MVLLGWLCFLLLGSMELLVVRIMLWFPVVFCARAMYFGSLDVVFCDFVLGFVFGFCLCFWFGFFFLLCFGLGFWFRSCFRWV